ncbi:MAG: flagellar hook assembly protein FlgD [Spirochaetes bacterium GWD1_61_31]|nr:MAG: flagellar hook assembly protein FlgD [Spirochaetes bacterium GWB1_60_80]OHD28518.1 MAG: flagellar hook assembly protein FlgD [Spirochaetes bacterium GWC1_61_12]OHD42180.1 MAG: flagellar hook assembly protein FlgD [Spirochaetes bacterium GWD1_61_31]OHD44510.1 MAG: flagellar hook assembly protein FlgD [Spirochaetes bacterium GWE1_60_18]OHD59338.1 MAG: flagellar hook assembly protein FlgD [Spirochaetes bacterium GWF1_60_12]HAP43165.1 flagellar hook assembly protein FlgD [Spirochaetaceae b
MNTTFMLNPAELTRARLDAEAVNRGLAEGRQVKQDLDKDDFLKILVTQLQHQDPTAPMEDREFIAQMAQFSSLEQMTNMSQNFASMAGVLNSSEAQSLLGRTVEILDGERTVYGPVSQVVRGEFPMVMVDGSFYDLDQVSKVSE